MALGQRRHGSPWNPLPPTCVYCGDYAPEVRGPDRMCDYHAERYDDETRRPDDEEGD